jgi:hypothetical protein
MPSLGSLSFWWRWIAANSLGELLGLGAVAALGYLVVLVTGEPEGMVHVVGMALLFVLAGSFEGLVLGYAQARVLVSQIPQLRGWTRATIVGAVVAWAIGMTPSTIMNLIEPASSAPPPAISGGLRLLLVAGATLAAAGAVVGAIHGAFLVRMCRRGDNAVVPYARFKT